MHLTTSAIMLAMSALPYILAGEHSMCYNYFLDKDGCVNSAKNENKRCGNPARQRNPPHTAVLMTPVVQTNAAPVTVQVTQEANNSGDDSDPSTEQSVTTNVNTPSKKLVRRYDTENSFSYTIAGGNGVCGNYTVDQPGACVWTGPANQTGDNPKEAGWLNGAFRKNCGKQVYITRKLLTGERVTVFVPIVDGCTFNEYKNETGCFRIAFTNKTFFDLKPSPEEQRAKGMDDLDWDWDNETGLNKTNGPY